MELHAMTLMNVRLHFSVIHFTIVMLMLAVSILQDLSHVVVTLDGEEIVSLLATSMSVLSPKTITVMPMPTAQIRTDPSVVHVIQVLLAMVSHVSTMMNLI